MKVGGRGAGEKRRKGLPYPLIFHLKQRKMFWVGTVRSRGGYRILCPAREKQDRGQKAHYVYKNLSYAVTSVTQIRKRSINRLQ